MCLFFFSTFRLKVVAAVQMDVQINLQRSQKKVGYFRIKILYANILTSN